MIIDKSIPDEYSHKKHTKKPHKTTTQPSTDLEFQNLIDKMFKIDAPNRPAKTDIILNWGNKVKEEEDVSKQP